MITSKKNGRNCGHSSMRHGLLQVTCGGFSEQHAILPERLELRKRQSVRLLVQQ